MTERGDSRATNDEERSGARDGTEGEPDAEPDDGHLDDVEDGAGCTEIWERLSERREE
ncbi:hypothetical protein [Halorubrum tropicale]|uniref:hypothetical protein n=1 Tax=Halorubrum tropicale TaxID=1765655 RepID=UPI000A5F3459|nr:hypothetical protein [Halorubrum tropicale]